MRMSFLEEYDRRCQQAEEAANLSAASDEERTVMLETRARAEELLERHLRGRTAGLPRIAMQHAITTTDFPRLLNRVLDTRFLSPIEPSYIGQSILATTVPVGADQNGVLYRFPSLGYLEAREVGETQLYPRDNTELNQNIVAIMIRKFGIEIAISEEAMKSDNMGLWGHYVTQSNLAMNRRKEQEIFTLFKTVVQPTFDNVLAWGASFLTNTGALGAPTTAAYATQGRGSDGELNGTLHLFDLIDSMSVLVHRGYPPTDIVMNPLAWAVLARNPILNGFYNNQRAMPADVMKAPMYTATGPADVGRIPLPWNVTLHVTPFAPVDSTNTGSAPAVTDIYVGSRQNGVILLQGNGPESIPYEEIQREITVLRLREYYGVGIADGARSWVSLKNVRIDETYEIVPTRLV